jgi:hypothetical protein
MLTKLPLLNRKLYVYYLKKMVDMSTCGFSAQIMGPGKGPPAMGA